MTAPAPLTLQPGQRRASDPAASAWVSANAGSGKTFVLAARVMRLLLAGTPPDRLLCLTFTKAAAAEMANRVFADLRVWATADDDALAARLAALNNHAPTANDLARARRLFAEALETPGGLKIQTINAFGESLLSRFPFEANVAADFKVIDEREAGELLLTAQETVFRAAVSEPDGPLGKALRHVTVHAGEGRIAELVAGVLQVRGSFRDWMNDAGGLAPSFEDLRAALGIDQGETLAGTNADILASPHLPRTEWGAIADAMPQAKATDVGFAKALKSAAQALDTAATLDAYLAAFTTKDGGIRKSPVTKDVEKEHPDLYVEIDAEKERLANLIAKRMAFTLHEGSCALFTLCDAIIRHYEAEKDVRGFIDYDDQIERTRQLLTRDQGAAWVLYKLDHGIDHILVDEAQDTNPRQWDIVTALSEEFFSGESARLTPRTVFAVGDEKQSIFSFQGADPAMFDTMRRHFARRAADAERPFEPVPLTASFRTVSAILGAVDTVFDPAENRRGVISDDIWSVHTATRSHEPGRVELWPAVERDAVEEVPAWRMPVDAPPENNPVQRNAARIAAVIQHWLKTGERIAPGGKAIAPEDILILVRKRGQIAEAVIRELKRRNLPVAGSDRIRLLDHIAVKDLLALARFVLQPDDDLTLAALLKSPLFGLDDDDLIALAPGRTGTLFEALSAHTEYAETRDALRYWLSSADRVQPFAFFSEVLGHGGGRKHFHGRLGREVDDVLDEFMSLVLRYQTMHTASLQGLVRFIEDADAVIKRDMDQGRPEIRVMTVHGAKGLEAPIVILADTLTKRAASQAPRILPLPRSDRVPGKPDPLVWNIRKTLRNEAVTAAVDAQTMADDDESRRLLYVALTRARDRLYIAGHNTDSKKSADEQDGHWFAIIHAALRDKATPVEDPYGLGFPVWRYGDLDEPGHEAAYSAPDDKDTALPDWLTRPAVPVPQPPRLVAPSSAWNAAPGDGGASDVEPTLPDPLAPPDVHRAAERGRLIHRLLQTLPDMAAADRHDAAARYLTRAKTFSEAERAQMAAEVMALFEAPGLAPVFSGKARAEIPVTGTVKTATGSIEVAGIVDRIAVLPDRVLIVDFKTNARPPASVDAVPDAYRTQMAVYRALLADIYPDRAIETVLIWTATAEAMPLPDAMLREALGFAS